MNGSLLKPVRVVVESSFFFVLGLVLIEECVPHVQYDCLVWFNSEIVFCRCRSFA